MPHDQDIRLSAIFAEIDTDGTATAADLAVLGDNAGLLTIPDRCAKCGRPILAIDVWAVSEGRLTVRVSGPHLADSWSTVPGRHAWTVDLHKCRG